MIPALYNLLMAILLALPFSPTDVKDAGVTVTHVQSLPENWSGWIGCGEGCEIKLLDPSQERHEVCHAVDYLSDGKMDGLIMGWQPWAGDFMAVNGDYTSDGERFGYWCGRQNVLPLAN